MLLKCDLLLLTQSRYMNDKYLKTSFSMKTYNSTAPQATALNDDPKVYSTIYSPYWLQTWFFWLDILNEPLFSHLTSAAKKGWPCLKPQRQGSWGYSHSQKTDPSNGILETTGVRWQQPGQRALWDTSLRCYCGTNRHVCVDNNSRLL